MVGGVLPPFTSERDTKKLGGVEEKPKRCGLWGITAALEAIGTKEIERVTNNVTG